MNTSEYTTSMNAGDSFKINFYRRTESARCYARACVRKKKRFLKHEEKTKKKGGEREREQNVSSFENAALEYRDC